jgi:purine nucleosidase
VRKIIIDTDTATDDAIAIIMALRCKDLDVVAITTVAGNVDIDLATTNALYTCELCGYKIPVYKGASGPLKRKLETSKFFHGKDGLGDTGPYEPKGKIRKKYAVDKIISLLKENPNELEIIAIGPLTNIAEVLKKDPEAFRLIKNLYVMGGIGEGKGNITEHAEFNFWVDPDAADAVLNSEVEAKVIAWDTTQLYGYLNEKNFDDLEKINTSLSRFSINIQQRGLEYYKVKYNEHKIDLADPLAMAVMINESETVYKKCKVSIVLNGEKRGRDIYKFIDSGKVQLATKVSRSNFLNILKSSLKK